MNQRIALPRGTGWVFLGVGILCTVWLLHSVLLPFVVGALAAYLLDPVADRLEVRGLGRGTATAVITIFFFALLITLLVTLLPMMLEQIMALIAAAPGVAEHLSQDLTLRFEHLASAYGQEPMQAFRQSVQNLSGAVAKMLGSLIESALHSGFAVLNLFSLLLITPVVTFYLLRDWDIIIAETDHLLPPRDAPMIRRILHDIDATLAGFLRGQVQVCVLMGLFYAAGLWLCGLKFGVIVGFLTGLLAILPYVGFGAGCITALVLASVQFGEWGPVMAVAAVFAVGQILEGYILTPKLVGAKVGLHPVWVIFALLAGGALFGFLGVLLAVPVAAVIGVLVRHAVMRWRNVIAPQEIPGPPPASPPPPPDAPA